MPDYKIIDTLPSRLYAIGDIHGCLDEVTCLLQHLEKSEGLTADDIVLFIGDYIDRGADSKGVIDLLIAFRTKYPKTIFLKGNHEDMLLSYLGQPGQMGDVWLANGGGETIASYGLAKDAFPADLATVMPRSHHQFFQSLERYAVSEKHVFVHAGLDPLRALHTQVDDDLFWIRDVFIQNIHYFDRLVFFGHTPFEDIVYNKPYKVGIDTGCVFGNKLSCVEVIGEKTFQVPKNGREVEVGEFPKE